MMHGINAVQVRPASKLLSLNSSTPVSDQDRISPYNIDTISSRQVTRIKKNIS